MKKTVQNYCLVEVVGEGMFGRVYKAVHVHNRREFAVKIMELRKLRKHPKLLEYAKN